MKRILYIFSFAVVLHFLAAGILCAQQMTWQIVGQNIATGFTPVAIAGEDEIVLVGGNNGLAISTNFGGSWRMITPPALQAGSSVNGIAIYDRNTFCVQSVVGNTYSKIYITNDQGTTWRSLFASTPFTVTFPLIFLNDPTKILCMGGGAFMLTRDAGTSFTTYATTLNPYQIRYASDGSLRLYSRTNTNVQAASSNDSGKSWNASSTIIYRDCFSFITDQTDPNTMCIINEDFFVHQHTVSMVFHTSDNGTSWDTTLNVALPYLGGSSDVGCYDYFVTTVANGILRSNDKGHSWLNIGGPATIADRDNIAAFDDSLIFVLDNLGKVWATQPQSHSGRVAVRNNLFFPAKTFSSCDSPYYGNIIITGNGCWTIPPKSVKIIGTDSLSYTITDSINTGYPDTVKVKFTPQHPGKINAKLRLTLLNGATQDFDLSTAVSSLGVAIFPQWLMDRDTLSYCSLLNGHLTLRTPCPQPIADVTISGPDSAAFQLVSSKTPVLPQDSDIVVNVIPIRPGLLNAILTVRTSANVIQNWVLRPFVSREKLALSYDKRISTIADTVYECQKVRDTIYLKAPCVLPTISLMLSDSISYKILGKRNIILPQDSMIVIEYDASIKNLNNKGTTLVMSSTWSDTSRVPIKHFFKRSPVLLERQPRMVSDSFSICNAIIDTFFLKSPCPHNLRSIRIEGTDASQFTIIGNTTQNLPTDSFIVVKLTPIRSGVLDATLVFESEDGTSWRFPMYPRIVPSIFAFIPNILFGSDSIGACSGGFDTLKIRTVCPGQITTMYITGPNTSSFILRSRAPMTLPRDSVIIVECLGGNPGKRNATLHIELADGRVWNIPISANIITAPLSLAPDSLFINDTIATCSFALDSIFLKAPCPLSIKSVNIIGADASSFSIFGKTPFTLPNDSLLVIKCVPYHSGSLSATVRIETSDGRVWLIRLTGAGAVSPFSVAPLSLFDNDTIAICATTSDTVSLRAVCSLGINSITIGGVDAASFALNGAATRQLPQDSLAIITCTPQHLGQLDAILHIVASDGRAFDIPMRPFVATSLLSIAPNVLFVNDSIVWCSSLRDSIMLRAICPLDVTSVTIMGADASSFSMLTTISPKLPNDSLVIVQCTPTRTGDLFATLHILSSDGRIWDVPMHLFATPSTLTISKQALFVADSFSVCSTVSDTLSLRSMCQYDITSLSISGADASSFVINGLGSLALPQDSVVTITCNPQHANTLSATLTLTGRDGRKWDIPMTAFAYSVSTFQFLPLADAMTDTIGGDIAIKIRSRHTGGVFGGEFTLHYDTASLIYRGVYDERGVEHTISRDIGTSRIAFNVASDSLLTANFSYFPVATDCVPITIDSITGTNGTLQCLNILTTSEQAMICASPSCGRGMLANYLRFGILRLSVMPNPSTGNITLVADQNVSDATIELIDALGIVRKTFKQVKLNQSGTPLDIESLPSGIYETRVTTEIGQGTVRWVLQR